MFALDVPSTVTQPDVPTLVAALPKDAKSMSGKFDQVLGLCFVKPNGPRVDGKYYSEGFDTNVNPAGSAFNYLFGIEHLHVNNDESVTLLQAPKHGTLSGVERSDGSGRYLYTPTSVRHDS